LKRSLKDDSYPYYYDEKELVTLLKFASILQHWEGEFAGKPIIFEPWQIFILGQLYGWRRKSDGKRRFKKAFIFVARKNGKTLLASVLMLYHLFAENGAQVYSIATKKDQARISWNNCKQFILRNKKLKDLCKIYFGTIVYPQKASKIEALSSESDTMDGLNPSFCLADEVAAYKSGSLIDVISSGMLSREDPLLVQITTGSASTSNIGYYEYERSQKVLQGIVEDDSYFTILYSIDSEDNWKDSSMYIKANPSLGITISLESLIRARDEATIAPYREQEFLIKNLNLFENISMSWISDKKAIKAAENWKKYDITKRDLSKLPCMAAIDLSKRTDFTSMTLVWYLEDIDKYVAKHHLYIPSEQVEQKMRKDSPLIKHWIDEGLITATAGEVIDYQILVNDLKKAITDYNIIEAVYDPALSGILEHLVEEQIPELHLTKFVQKPIYMAPLTTEYETILVGEKLCDCNPAWRWMLSNATIQVGGTGLVYIDKIDDRKSSRRIDCVITSIMALGRLQQYIRDNTVTEYIPLSEYTY